MKHLTFESVIKMHSVLIQQTGGLDGVRDMGMLDMSLNSPYHTFGGNDLYPSLELKAAHLAFSLVKNHPFLDGNKRIGILAMLVLLEINGLSAICTDEEVVELGFALADNRIDESALVDWIITHSA
jgi:death-on-curing protein